MIIFIEGPRHSGKTYLIEQFIKANSDPRLEYYKFYFANHVKTLDLVGLDSTPALHYFSLGNIMTIMEMNLRPEYKDKVWLFDRAIISAYTWATLRKRLSPEIAKKEYLSLLNSDLYKNCKTVFVQVEGQTADTDRSKDTWDGAHSTQEELSHMAELIEIGRDRLSNEKVGNSFSVTVNDFTQASVDKFNQICSQLLLENDQNK